MPINDDSPLDEQGSSSSEHGVAAASEPLDGRVDGSVVGSWACTRVGEADRSSVRAAASFGWQTVSSKSFGLGADAVPTFTASVTTAALRHHSTSQLRVDVVAESSVTSSLGLSKFVSLDSLKELDKHEWDLFFMGKLQTLIKDPSVISHARSSKAVSKKQRQSDVCFRL